MFPMPHPEKGIRALVITYYCGAKALMRTTHPHITTTKEKLRFWLTEAKKEKAVKMIVCTDPFEWHDFPVLLDDPKRILGVLNSIKTTIPNLIVMEVYDLRLDIESQLLMNRALFWDDPPKKAA